LPRRIVTSLTAPGQGNWVRPLSLLTNAATCAAVGGTALPVQEYTTSLTPEKVCVAKV